MTTNKKYYSQTPDTDNLMYETKTEDLSDKEIFDFSNYSTKSKYRDGSNKLFIGKIKDQTGDVVIVVIC